MSAGHPPKSPIAPTTSSSTSGSGSSRPVVGAGSQASPSREGRILETPNLRIFTFAGLEMRQLPEPAGELPPLLPVSALAGDGVAGDLHRPVARQVEAEVLARAHLLHVHGHDRGLAAALPDQHRHLVDAALSQPLLLPTPFTSP